MADGFSSSNLPLTTHVIGNGYNRYDEFCNGDVTGHGLNFAGVVAAKDSILNKLDSRDALDNLRETLKSECALQKSIAEVGYAVRENAFRLKEVECQLRHEIKDDGQRTRDVTRAGFQRLDDQLIADLRLRLELTKQSCCPCGGGVTVPTPV